MVLSKVKFPVIIDFKSDLNLFNNVSELSFEDVKIGSIIYKGHEFFHVKPIKGGQYAFGGNYLDISSSKSLVEIYGCDKLKIHDRYMSLEK